MLTIRASVAPPAPGERAQLVGDRANASFDAAGRLPGLID
jgi:hypothetical protein